MSGGKMYPGRIQMYVPGQGWYASFCLKGGHYFTEDQRLACWFLNRDCAEWVAELEGITNYDLVPVP